MALLKKKIILLNKTKIQQNPQHIELVNLVEQPNNHLEQIIKICIDKNISLPDIIKEKSPNDEVLQSQIYDIYFRLVKEIIHSNTTLQPNTHQQQVLDRINEWYSKTNIGKIIWGCGLGKALLSLFIIKQMNFKSVVIGVPSNYLQKQMITEILKLFPNEHNILCVGGTNYKYKSTTNLDTIKHFLNNENDNLECKFIITTYASCHLLTYNKVKHNFNFKVGDEAHH